MPRLPEPFWGIGHSITLLIIGGAIILFGVFIPERIAMTLEFCVALMLVLLGVLNLGSFRRRLSQAHEDLHRHSFRLRLRLAIVGVVHGLAGSAAVALLVVPMIRNPHWATFYLLIFGAGTIAGMMLITAIIAVPINYFANRFHAFNRYIGTAAGVLSMLFGLFLAHHIAFGSGLFR